MPTEFERLYPLTLQMLRVAGMRPESPSPSFVEALARHICNDRELLVELMGGAAGVREAVESFVTEYVVNRRDRAEWATP